MHDSLQLTLVFLMGIVMGAVFFGGLCWTVSKTVRSKQPSLLFLTSLILRTGLLLSGFYLIGGDDSLRFLICLSGFVCTRFIVTRLCRPDLLPNKSTSLSDRHAS